MHSIDIFCLLRFLICIQKLLFMQALIISNSESKEDSERASESRLLQTINRYELPRQIQQMANSSIDWIGHYSDGLQNRRDKRKIILQ